LHEQPWETAAATAISSTNADSAERYFSAAAVATAQPGGEYDPQAVRLLAEPVPALPVGAVLVDVLFSRSFCSSFLATVVVLVNRQVAPES
jgi:hypothetical protein